MWDLGVGDYLVKGGNYTLRVAQYSGDPQAAHARVNVAATPIPSPGESMRDRAEAFAGVRI
jgi:hypothetical protein